ncbi:zinc finger BED domain-containing protein RICESLEEPER 2-like protein [Tanacetum coccineum]
MAMDIISVQASSVASESAFSTSGRVLSIRRTRLTPASLEMCMCLKDHLDANVRKQDKCHLKTPLDFEEGVFDDEVQQNEAIPLSDEEIALDASSEGTMSPGGPRYDYMSLKLPKKGTEEPEFESGANVYGSRWECFQDTMQPKILLIVSRSTLKRDAMKLWLAAKQEIIDSFGNINACVNLTTDVWFAPHRVPGSYMCVTAHWIEPGTWQMMKRVISFEEFSSPHTNEALFKMLIKVLTNFNLEDKVMSITLDNASNNTSAMDKLKLKYDPPMGGRFYHSRCVAHIIKLVVQAGLGVPAIDAIRESFKTMLKDIFKSSAKTRQRYVKICKDANEKKPLFYWTNWTFQHDGTPLIICS